MNIQTLCTLIVYNVSELRSHDFGMFKQWLSETNMFSRLQKFHNLTFEHLHALNSGGVKQMFVMWNIESAVL